MRAVSLKTIVLLLLAFAASAMAQKTFYFLPPYEPDWMRKAPRLIDIDAGTITAMKIAPELCGWYKATIESGQLGNELIIWQGKVDWAKYPTDKTTDRLGVRGQDEASDEWKGASPPLPEAIVFNNISQASGSAVYFNPSIGMAGWSATEPSYNTDKYCNYRMAGLIYDTDKSVMNGSFTRYYKDDGMDSKVGIKKGIVKPTLIKNNKGVSKMQWNSPSGDNASNWNEGDFNTAFECTQGKNALVCYDMPFKKDSKGLWTFSSDFLCPDNSLDLRPSPNNFFTNQNAGALSTSLCGSVKPMLSFAPDRLNGLNGYQRGIDDPTPLDSRCTYTNCSACATTNPNESEPDGAEPATPFDISKVSPACYERGIFSQNGTPAPGTANPNGTCGSTLFGQNDLGDGDRPTIWCWAGNDNCRNEIRKNMYTRTLNSYFCFESHATFVYELGQEFYFSGDDDIWVFINNNLVIDLGGTHLASPGYVNLDSIGKGGRWQSMGTALTEGTEYPIDIFFCDRRTNASNIRISTNMFIVQETGILYKPGGNKDPSKTVELCVKKSGAGSCEALLGSGGSGNQTLCGAAVNGVFEFYLQKRGSSDPPEILSASNPRCQDLGGSKLLCYDGITVDMSNGTFLVNKNNTDLNGVWYLYAQVKEGNSIIKPPLPDPMLVATIQKIGKVRMAWGNIREMTSTGEELLKGKGVTCKKDINAPTGQLVPVCFSAGDLDLNGINFITEDFVSPTSGSAGIGGMSFRLNSAGFTNNEGKKLKIYRDEEGTEEVTNLNETFYIPTRANGNHPPDYSSGPGVLVLWVKSDYVQDDRTFPYKINAIQATAEPVTFNSIVPDLYWVFKKAPNDTVIIDKAHQKWAKWNNGNAMDGPLIDPETNKPTPEWVQSAINFNIMAYWMDGSTKKLCTSCTFSLNLASAVAEGSNAPTETNSNLIKTQGLDIKNGEAEKVEIAGLKEVVDPSFAKFTLKGPSKLQELSWENLQFERALIPVPQSAMIFDKNGDGIGDSLVIVYNRGFKRDSLPNMIEVSWDLNSPSTPADTIAYFYGIGKLNDKGKYSLDNINKAANYDYWAGSDASGRTFLHLDRLFPDIDARMTMLDSKLDDIRDTIIITRDPKKNELALFSKEILTKNVKSTIANWATFQPKPGKGQDNRFQSGISDSIPAIITSATYQAQSGCGMGSKGDPCVDKLTFEFSEPVLLDKNTTDATPNELKNPFAYVFVDIPVDKNWRILEEDRFLPNTMTSKFNTDAGDSLVYLSFDRWRGNDFSKTPIAGDWVKFASKQPRLSPDDPNKWDNSDHGLAKNLLVDAAGNKPNPAEIGIRIEGRKPFTQEKIPVGTVDPNNPGSFRPGIGATLESPEVNSKDPGVINDMFTKDRPVEILPLPPTWDSKKAQENYPGTVGVVLSPDVFNQISDLEKPVKDGGLGIKIPDENISFYAKVFYHTNLGIYVADRAIGPIKCNDPIFTISEKTGEASCRENKNKIYIAWNMKDFKNRYVGTGAYVGLYDFHWEVLIPEHSGEPAETRRMESIDGKVEMHGVKRTKAKK